MSFDSLLIDLCAVRRYVAGAQDAYGNPAKAWADHLVDQPCRFSVPNPPREIKVGAEVVLVDFELFLLDVDVTEQDRVVSGGITYEVLAVSRRQNGVGAHHRECFLRTVR